jgi:4'-phosphopantetheinyl transferase
MEVYWFEQTAAQLPRESDWLSPAELMCLNGMRFARRRSDWLLGRWTAKHALSLYLDISRLREIEVLAAPSGAPQVRVGGKPAAVEISLSHRSGTAVCTIAPSPCALGCDLEAVEPHSEAFVADFFRPEEQLLVAHALAGDRPLLIALLWSGKESVLKALRCGLRIDTREVVVTYDTVLACDAAPCDATWRPLEACYAGAQVFRGWWHCSDELVRTVVADPPPAPPVMLGV